jgi:hypothetical protein
MAGQELKIDKSPVESGSNYPIPPSRDNQFWRACHDGDIDEVEKLLPHVNVNIEGKYFKNNATEQPDSEVQNRAAATDANDFYLVSAIFVAIDERHFNVALRLLREPGIQLGRRYLTKERTALYQAITEDAGPDLVEKLLAYNKTENFVDSRDYKGSTALIHAASWGMVGAARILLRHGADVKAVTDERKESALHKTATFGGVPPYLEMARLLLIYGAEVNSKDRFGKTRWFYLPGSVSSDRGNNTKL